MNNQPVWEAFQAAVAGNNEASIRHSFEELYRATKREMLRFAVWCVRKHSADLVPAHILDAEEVVQEAFAELYRKCRNIEKDPRRWILGTIRRTVQYRVSRAWRECKGQLKAQETFDEWRKPRGIRCSLSDEGRIAVRSAVRALPVRMRAVIIALVYRNESVATAATKLGISENAVIQARRRALRKLEELLVH